LVVRRWLKINDYKPVMPLGKIESSSLIRQRRFSFTEIRGRGCWHQIDVPCDYSNYIPFVNPIRLLVEVKFLSKVVSKEHVRAFIGVVKDISENYFVSPHCNGGSGKTKDTFKKIRYNELGVMFSASGFNKEAEGLAYAHNIQTVSYKNNPLVDSITSIIKIIEEEDLYAEFCLSKNVDTDFKQAFYSVLQDRLEAAELITRFRARDSISVHISMLKESMKRIKSVFFGTTPEGIVLQFFSKAAFPDGLFSDTNDQQCEVYYEGGVTTIVFYMIFRQDAERHRYYFIPPKPLLDAISFGQNETLFQKARYFTQVSVVISIAGLKRLVSLNLRDDWTADIRKPYKAR
ncbi:MAG: hypothetical protein LHW64_01630, partial [Candidatus Cloacimonetes bacterium]|nr:hypothetical protein [Candidatus Cloacimonadota bacterium]MDY0228808.1 hypothetical protein [Candidatus Cloacimonadaceae bacterium]